MSENMVLKPILVDQLWQEQDASRWVRRVTLAVVGSALLWISAKIQVPFWPVPMTMQTLVVLGIGMAYGPRLAMATIMLYLAQGAMGLPVFAGTPEKGIGLAYMLSGTGGYLVGFVFAAGIVGWLAQRGWDRNVLTVALAMLIGNIVIYAMGVAWLSGLIGFEKAYTFGLVPFIAGDIAKLILAACLLPFLWKVLGKEK